jgi:hypothetical protein
MENSCEPESDDKSIPFLSCRALKIHYDDVAPYRQATGIGMLQNPFISLLLPGYNPLVTTSTALFNSGLRPCRRANMFEVGDQG